MDNLDLQIKDLKHKISSLEDKQRPHKLTFEEGDTLRKKKDGVTIEGIFTLICTSIAVLFFVYFIFGVAGIIISFILVIGLLVWDKNYVENLKIKKEKYDSIQHTINSMTQEKNHLVKLSKDIKTKERIQEIKNGASFMVSDYNNKKIVGLWRSIGNEKWKKDFKAFSNLEIEREKERQRRQSIEEARASRRHMVGLIKADIREAELDLLTAEKYSGKYDYAMERLARYEAELTKYNY